MSKLSKYWLVFLLFSGLFINALDRMNISVSSTAMMKDLHINPGVMGILFSAFFWTYLLFNIPIGAFADRVGTKKAYAIAVALYSLATMATGLFRTLPGIIACRAAVGAGEAGAFPMSTKVVNETFESHFRGTVTGIYMAGFRLGFAATPVFVAFIISRWGWQASFYITGLISLVWVGLWLATYPKTKLVNGAASTKKFDWDTMKKLLKERNTIAIVVIKFFQDYLFFLFVTWLPGYLVIQRHFTLMKMGIYASLPWIVGMFATPAIGMLSDALIRRGINRTAARKVPMIVCQLLAATVIMTGWVESPMVAVWLVILGVAAEGGSSAVLWTVPADLARPGEAGTLGGIMNTAGAAAGILSPIVTGYIVATTHSFNAAFVVAGIMIIVATFAVIFLLGEVEQMGSTVTAPAKNLSLPS
ncbi:MAG: MFS transporter [Negativicutes bacterium]|nr:MFS transporter [Negativicutes bacterium]